VDADGRDKIEGISRVEVNGCTTVRVRLSGCGRSEFLMVEALWGWQEQKFVSIAISGGNTGGGSADVYEEASRVYGSAVAVARLMEGLLYDPDSYFDGYDDDLLAGRVAGMPDYLCGLYLLLKGESTKMLYERGYDVENDEVEKENVVHDFVGLNGLRARVLVVAQETHEKARASA
jgi:hypothetical protein